FCLRGGGLQSNPARQRGWFANVEDGQQPARTIQPMNQLTLQMEEALAEVPMLDPHTHLVGGKLGARGLHDVLLYHMVVSDLYAAGCPTGARLTQFPQWPSEAESHARILEALPYLRHIQ